MVNKVNDTASSSRRSGGKAGAEDWSHEGHKSRVRTVAVPVTRQTNKSSTGLLFYSSHCHSVGPHSAIADMYTINHHTTNLRNN